MITLFAVLLAILAIQYVRKNRNEIQYFKTRISGDEIVIALLKYKGDKGVYPDTLKRLVPTYIQKIKSPIWGDPEWGYFSEENGKEFVLLVRGPGESNQTYSTIFGYWYNGPQATPVD